MDLHLVGGFLGSGKTTAIIAAAKYLMGQGKRVGVVTNDLGKYLVDTAFSHMAQVPTVEVTGGCFCCNFEEFEKQVERLTVSTQPDVIFAESIGSCADIVATVIKPLLELRQNLAVPSSFSVFADCRLLRRRLLGQDMPFSEHVVYIFDKQIEEAGLIVVNKKDLLPAEQLQEIEALLRQVYPGKTVYLQNSLDPASVAGWTELLAAHVLPLPDQSLSIDYRRYGEAKARLAWLDERVELTAPQGQGREAVLRLIQALLAGIRRRGIAIGHVKFFVQGGDQEAKVSIPSLEEAGWQESLPVLPAGKITVLINGAVEADPEILRQIVQDSIGQTLAGIDPGYTEEDVAFFSNRFPEPTHRVD